MKKLLCALLAIVLLCACAAAETADVTGTWYLNEIQTSVMTLNPAMLGMELVLTLNPDGTAVTTSTASAEQTGVWEMDGETVNVTIAGNPQALSLDENGNLVGVEAETGTTMVYGREKTEAVYFDPGTALTDVTTADFDGTWRAAIVNMGGVEVPAFATGAEITIELSGGNGTVTELASGADEPRTYAVNGELADGVLTITEADSDADTPAGMALQLYDSGVMVYAEGDMGVIYFERAETAESAA